MKFAYFSHVWGSPGETPEQRYRRLWWEVELADLVGFDYAFSVEHHFTPHESWMPSPAIFCTGAAMRTERIRVGPMGYVPPLHHPLRIVEEVAALDQVLGGRLDVGLAPGVTPDFFGPYGADFARRKELVDECIDLMRTAFRADGAFDFDGPVHRLRDVTLSFGPVQRPHPPLWVPTGSRHALRNLARIGAHTATTMITPRVASRAVYQHFVNWWRAAGHPGKPNIGYWTLVHVADTDDEAVNRAAPQIRHTLTEVLGYGQRNAEHNAQRSGRGDGAGPAELNTATILARAGDIEFLLDHNLIFVGSPDSVARQIRQAAAEGHFNTVFAELHLAQMTEGDIKSSVELFAAEVMPALRQYEPY